MLRPRVVSLTAIFFAACLLAGCQFDVGNLFSIDPDDTGSDRTAVIDDTAVAGLAVAASNYDFDTTVSRVADAEPATGDTLNAGIARIDLAARASRPRASDQDDINLRATTVLRFADSDRALALINADRRAALDLPAAILVYQDRAGDVGVAYDDARYWQARFALDSANDGALDALVADLSQTVSTAAGNDATTPAADSDIGRGEGIATQTSSADFATTVSRLTNAINADDRLARIATVDWSARAHDRGGMIGNNDDRLSVYFIDAGANAARLIAGNQTAGIDAPVRIVVSEADNGQVTLYYDRPAYIASRHDITGQANAVSALDQRISALVDRAAGGR